MDETFEKEIYLKIRTSPKKIEILLLLEKLENLYQSELAKRINLKQTTTRTHLQELKKLHLVTEIKISKFLYYKLTELGHKLVNQLKKTSNTQ